MISLEQYRTVIGNFNLKYYDKGIRGSKGYNSNYRGKYRGFIGVKMIGLIWIFIVMISMYDQICSSNRNKECHITNGNICKSKKSLDIMHWNKGPAHLQNKSNDMNYILDRYKPDIFSLSEANLVISRDNGDIGYLSSYNYEYTDQLANFDISRQILIIDKQIVYKRRRDLESKFDCCIWIEIQLKGQKPLLVMGGYRQWSILNLLI